MTNQSQAFEERYGLKKRAKRNRRLVIWLAALLGAVLVGWILAVAFAPQSATSAVSGQVNSFHASSNISATVQVVITKPASATVVCQVSAANGAGSSVGSKQFEVATPGSSVSVNLNLTTTQPASQGVVDFCHLR